jgi:hypothetical protein
MFVNINFGLQPECLQILCIDDIWDLCREKGKDLSFNIHNQNNEQFKLD